MIVSLGAHFAPRVLSIHPEISANSLAHVRRGRIAPTVASMHLNIRWSFAPLGVIRPVVLVHIHVLGIGVAGWMLGWGWRDGHKAVLLQPLDVEDLH